MKGRRQIVVGTIAAMVSIGAFVTGIVLLEQFAFGDQRRWHDLVSQRKGTTCIGVGWGGNYEGGDSAIALIVVVTVQFACALAAFGLPLYSSKGAFGQRSNANDDVTPPPS